MCIKWALSNLPLSPWSAGGLCVQTYFFSPEFLHFWGIHWIQLTFQILLKPPAPLKAFSDSDVALKYLFQAAGANLVEICSDIKCRNTKIGVNREWRGMSGCGSKRRKGRKAFRVAGAGDARLLALMRSQHISMQILRTSTLGKHRRA